METKFTPGPWEVVESWLGELNVVARKRDRCFGIALNVGGEITFTEKGYTDKSEGTANAHLIAAAPDMYRLLDTLCKMDEAEVCVKEPWEHAFGEARELLKKVRGE